MTCCCDVLHTTLHYFHFATKALRIYEMAPYQIVCTRFFFADTSPHTYPPSRDIIRISQGRCGTTSKGLQIQPCWIGQKRQNESPTIRSLTGYSDGWTCIHNVKEKHMPANVIWWHSILVSWVDAALVSIFLYCLCYRSMSSFSTRNDMFSVHLFSLQTHFYMLYVLLFGFTTTNWHV